MDVDSGRARDAVAGFQVGCLCRYPGQRPTHSFKGSVPDAPAHVSVRKAAACGGGGGAQKGASTAASAAGMRRCWGGRGRVSTCEGGQGHPVRVRAWARACAQGTTSAFAACQASFSSCALRPVRGHFGPLHACKRARSARALITAQNPGQELEQHAQAGREQDASTRIHHLQISGARAPELRRADRIPDRRAVFITVQSYKEGCQKFTACDVVV